MLQEILLQLLLSLIPVIGYVLWRELQKDMTAGPLVIGILSASSMVICKLFWLYVVGMEEGEAGNSPIDPLLDFGIIPYIIGSASGGLSGLIILSILQFLLQVGMPGTPHLLLLGIYSVLQFTLLYIVFIKKEQHMKNTALTPWYLSSAIILYVLYTLLRPDALAWNASPVGVFHIVFMLVLLFVGLWFSVLLLRLVQNNMTLEATSLAFHGKYENEAEKLRQFVTSTMTAVIIVDKEQRVTHCNKAALTMLSISPAYATPESVLTLPAAMIFEKEAAGKHMPLLRLALEGKNTLRQLQRGERNVLLQSAFPLREKSRRVTSAVLVAHDVTELSLLREEVGRIERLSLVGQMAASITHEIRNPLAVIRGFVQLLQERSDESQQAYFQIVLDELDRTNMIVSDFLSLAQNRAIPMEIQSLHEIVEELLPLLHADANMRGQSVDVALSEKNPHLLLNPREIKQLILNLSRNGMEAMKQKGVLRISTIVEKCFVQLRISDTGIGIPPDQVKQMFDPFYTTKTSGTGLGLPLCLSIAERHNGRIDVESTETVGTTFIVTLSLTEELGTV